MKLVLNEKNEILSYISLGDVDGAVDYQGEIPEDFYEKFKPEFYMLVDGAIGENPDYVEPSSSLPTGPSDLQNIVMQQAKTIAQIQQMLMQQNNEIAKLKGVNA